MDGLGEVLLWLSFDFGIFLTCGQITQDLPSSSLCELIFQPLGTDLSPFTKLDSGVLGRIVIFSHFWPIFIADFLEAILGVLCSVLAFGFLLADSSFLSSKGLFSASLTLFFFKVILKGVLSCTGLLLLRRFGRVWTSSHFTFSFHIFWEVRSIARWKTNSQSSVQQQLKVLYTSPNTEISSPSHGMGWDGID